MPTRIYWYTMSGRLTATFICLQQCMHVYGPPVQSTHLIASVHIRAQPPDITYLYRHPL